MFLTVLIMINVDCRGAARRLSPLAACWSGVRRGAAWSGVEWRSSRGRVGHIVFVSVKKRGKNMSFAELVIKLLRKC